MAEDISQKPIIIKRIKKIAGQHHGGAWKIAYADFVTAMMAFFLLMWLLGSTTQGDKEGIAEYFKTPLKVALLGGDGSGDSTSVVKGGGDDISKKIGQMKRSDFDDLKRSIDMDALQALQDRFELEQLEKLKARIEDTINSNPALNKFKSQLLLDITSEGLRIQIVDEKNRPMFSMGRAELQSYTKMILHEIGKMLNDVGNKISLSGHTDATPYPTGEKSYSNWELSADRANASRRELIAGGMSPEKMLRVVGLSSAVMFDKADPFSPFNRRISIIVMNKKAEDAITRESLGEVDIHSKEEVDSQIIQ
ncbi:MULTISPECIES: flagellar motor protein MotB [Nitrosomonas]|uniref:Bacterial outer membrane protein n=1 Tax=Nitrosomonas europaea (strain ATCC 19718 / CIP 103999 / KCTC 2705 / NBRC 14298) TaxID=228410 RepID=Q82Y43_NITEU|nr:MULTISPECIES: flagellar motor protein MotB [Nitrosomonas]MCE7917476.1 motility protein MotB [Nitrosomonas sp. PRO5]KXK42366.1 MAG: flagellar motor protein MotB [Nitrosomonas europaea]MBV6389309.1 Motility protein B [Nitrosomonas europaea]MEB2331371.1 flagellar motor protein MotB [Nitrosomonas sp.]QOJ09885.1 MAG: flagellar motor protein MotB [Nitrosomonas sp. H1_AOB3]